MPNWCLSYLDVRGSKEKVKEFDAKFKAKHSEYDCATTTCSKDKFNEEEYNKHFAYRINPYKNPFASEQSRQENVSVTFISLEEVKEGYSFHNFIPMSKDDCLNGWHDWSCSNWGTKWDAHEMNENLDDIENGEAYYQFETAWSPCIPVIEAMAKAFPELEFVYTYEEDGMCFAGKITLNGGEYVENLESNGYENDDAGEEGYDDFRAFKHDILERDYYKCADCGALIEEYEVEDEGYICPKCASAHLLQTDHKTELVQEELVIPSVIIEGER